MSDSDSATISGSSREVAAITSTASTSEGPSAYFRVQQSPQATGQAEGHDQLMAQLGDVCPRPRSIHAAPGNPELACSESRQYVQ
eukprot:CAMPEP_0114563208 /NCGR_PEP_ID=MMETSP0114-20121206/12976_1 /TAXON_ID=31324 /ORGANISM="Goniomonas sp, Strain m" /LENGTH=84 /DNA_ID=CAMNT_0001749017 /DNA_START=269 /DNA_END=524 /DNA_ORIENTATION=+